MSDFDFTLTFTRDDIDAPTVYTPWTDGHAVGFRAEHSNGTVEYIYLNPSSDDTLNVPNVFLYIGTDADQAEPCHYYELLGGEQPSPLHKEATRLADDVTTLAEETGHIYDMDDRDPDRVRYLIAVNRKLEQFMDRALGLEDRIAGATAASVADSMARMETAYEKLTFEVAGISSPGSLAVRRRRDRTV